jgi:hypothetical protein
VSPEKRVHLLFTLVMGSTMVVLMSALVTAVNVGPGPEFPGAWLRALLPAWCAALPILYFLAPPIRGLCLRWAGGVG